MELGVRYVALGPLGRNFSLLLMGFGVSGRCEQQVEERHARP